ncbi:MAG: UDP-N-acetylmuramoyl-L-alanyl-D-glutamate--2,6-diaminopimelate ligase [Proteobacteria bacterium]|nr:UDP-N-acetylmuramoyl-L-alanyl-D-glutamate--2,6-diaminopimelate ligase [Pseudomonadota bacterium]
MTSEAAAILSRLPVKPRRIVSDSRRVAAGDAFAAYKGTRADGRAFIGDAIARGAVGVLWDDAGFAWKPEWVVPNAAVPKLAQRLGFIADFIYGHPSRALWTVGVTGTNGKTSCTQWIAQALTLRGRPTGIVGTLGNGMPGALTPGANTTPDAAELQAVLAAMVAEGARGVALEVSSHGLDQGRVNGVKFDVAVFTNLTRDHLDYHGTMAAYGAAKAQLFSWPSLKVRVVNADDAFGQHLIETLRRDGRPVMTYGRTRADVRSTAVATTSSGIVMDVETPAGRGTATTAMIGDFNVHNLLATLATLLASDVPFDDALAALGSLTPPPGRMQRLGGDHKPTVVVDYAHTPDALAQALAALRPAVAEGGELVVVFGAGGDRDPGKRGEMGAIAARLADRVIVTSDNPRSEDPGAIAQAIVDGVNAVPAPHAPCRLELDRAAAIGAAVSRADVGDVVLIAGKGHEAYQEQDGVRTPFSDVDMALAALATR